MTHNIYIYILIMGGISYLIRVLPVSYTHLTLPTIA